MAGFLLTACASTFDFRKEELFETSSKRYGRMIRWSEFENARGYFAADVPQARTEPPRNIQVTGYEPSQIAVTDDRQHVVQVVKVSYFKLDDPRIRTLEDHQTWEFDAERGVWYLKSGFPEFK
jgi:hypothetical protein